MAYKSILTVLTRATDASLAIGAAARLLVVGVRQDRAAQRVAQRRSHPARPSPRGGGPHRSVATHATHSRASKQTHLVARVDHPRRPQSPSTTHDSRRRVAHLAPDSHRHRPPQLGRFAHRHLARNIGQISDQACGVNYHACTSHSEMNPKEGCMAKGEQHSNKMTKKPKKDTSPPKTSTSDRPNPPTTYVAPRGKIKSK